MSCLPHFIYSFGYLTYAAFGIETDKITQATILSTATEYIGHLENRTLGLTKENKALQTRIEAFEILFVALDTSDSAKHAMPTGS
jgi:hypothetical protein